MKGCISSLRTNSQGSLVSILVTSDGIPSPRIIIYVVDRDVVSFYDFDSLGQYVSRPSPSFKLYY